jgi:hypothetical protein
MTVIEVPSFFLLAEKHISPDLLTFVDFLDALTDRVV